MRRRHTSDELLDPRFLLNAYAIGYFPMAKSKNGPISWYSPDPRAVFDLERFKASRSLRQTIRKKIFDVRIDTAFEEVMRRCSARAETWISETIIQSYYRLHTMGFAHSVESWKDEELVGGLYGVALGGAFFGESMFSRRTDASKVALVHLVERLKSRGFLLLDTQFTTPHLAQFGVTEISRSEYLDRLTSALAVRCSFES